MSLGEDRVRVRFNPSDISDVAIVKNATATLIDLCEKFKKDGESARLAALAQTAYEEAVMWAAKAATS